MLSSVLTSERAVQMNIVIIRAFLKMREMLASHKDLADRIQELTISGRTRCHSMTPVISLPVSTKSLSTNIRPKS